MNLLILFSNQRLTSKAVWYYNNKHYDEKDQNNNALFIRLRIISNTLTKLKVDDNVFGLTNTNEHRIVLSNNCRYTLTCVALAKSIQLNNSEIPCLQNNRA